MIERLAMDFAELIKPSTRSCNEDFTNKKKPVCRQSNASQLGVLLSENSLLKLKMYHMAEKNQIGLNNEKAKNLATDLNLLLANLQVF